MRVTQERDSESQPCDTEVRYLLRTDLFRKLMAAKGLTRPTAIARRCRIGRSTLGRLEKREDEATLGVAMRLAGVASTTVEKLFEPVPVGE